MMRKTPDSTIRKALAAVAAAAFLSSAAWSQEPRQSPSSTETPAEPQGKPEAQAGAESQSPAAADKVKDAAGEGKAPESVLDDQTYEGEDDDFIPTEEIPLNEPIPFPTDI